AYRPVPLAKFLGAKPDRRCELIARLAFVLAQRFTQQLAQQPDFGAKAGLGKDRLGRRRAHGFARIQSVLEEGVHRMAEPNGASPLKRHSARLTEGDDRAGARAMLRAIGFTRGGLRKPMIGVGHRWIE